MLDIFSRAGEYPIEFASCILLAATPAMIWIWIFNRKYKENILAIVIAFVLGMGSALIMLIYQYYWGKEFNLGFFAVQPLDFQKNIKSNFLQPIIASFLLSMSIGLIEEYSKHWVVKWTDHKFFRSVDDVIVLSIVAALGFAFLENIGYFFRIILRDSGEELTYLFFMRSIFSTFLHVLCSGIYGYYYGVGYFSKCVFNEKYKDGKKFIVPEILHKIFHFKRERVFHDEMISLGLIISSVMHGFYNFILDINLSVGQVLRISSLDHIAIHTIIFPVMLIFGFYFLDSLIGDKTNRRFFGKKIVEEVFICKCSKN